MRNEPTPTKYINKDKSYSQLHSGVLVLWFFDSLKDVHHHCGMNNLHNSANSCPVAYQHDRKVLCHGVTRKGLCGIPECVNARREKESKGTNNIMKVQGTIKVDILIGDSRVPCLIESSVYDTKSVHYLLMLLGQEN